MCIHQPPCPPAGASDATAARVVASQPQQGWTLLCNGVIVFDDTGELLPDGTAIAPRRPAVSRSAATRPDDGDVRTLVARIAAAQAAGRELGLRRANRRPVQWLKLAG